MTAAAGYGPEDKITCKVDVSDVSPGNDCDYSNIDPGSGGTKTLQFTVDLTDQIREIVVLVPIKLEYAPTCVIEAQLKRLCAASRGSRINGYCWMTKGVLLMLAAW